MPPPVYLCVFVRACNFWTGVTGATSDFTRLLLAELARGKEQSQQHLDSLEDQINALRLTFGLLSVGFSAFASLSDQIGLSILFSRSIRTQMDVIFLLIRA